MKQRHMFIGLAVLGTAAPIAIGALITGNAMAADGASDSVVASVSMIVPDPDGEGSIECTVDGIDMSGEAVLVGEGEVFAVTVSGDAQAGEGQFIEGQPVEGQVFEGQLDAGQLEAEGTVIGQSVFGQTGAIPVDGEAFELVPFDFGDVRQGTPEECASLDQPMMQVLEAP